MTRAGAGTVLQEGTAGGLVTFSLGARDYATPLASVREVVRLEGLSDVPGMLPPLAGVLDLRGTALPVLDLRAATGPTDRGDVLVLEPAEGTTGLVGVAVDRVRAVVARQELPPAGAVGATGSAGAAGEGTTDEGVLPSYVVDVLRGPGGPVFLVDVAAMVDAVRVARTS